MAVKAGSTEKKWNHAWAFNIYNAYARKNAYTYLFRSSKTNPRAPTPFQEAIKGTRVPVSDMVPLPPCIVEPFCS